MAPIIKRRFPAYLGGFLLGLAAVLVLMQVKRALAPKFVDVPDERAVETVSSGGRVRLKYHEDPGLHLAPGFPNQLFLGKKKPDGRIQPVARLEHSQLVQETVVLGPLEAGSYELRAIFYACESPGVATCARILLLQPLEVVEKAGIEERAIELPLKAVAARFVTPAAAPNQP